MAKFLTRVELHGAKHGDNSYDILHDAMKESGFERTITSDNGSVWHLPTAEYYYEGDETPQQVMKLASDAADQTGKDKGIIVVPNNGCYWKGLERSH